MDIFRDALMDSYGSEGSYFDFPCRVRMDADLIVVEYDWDDGARTYRGYSNGAGHYRLTADGFKGEATLHRFPDAPVLEGYWVEEEQQGMWRIRLNFSAE